MTPSAAARFSLLAAVFKECLRSVQALISPQMHLEKIRRGTFCC